MSWPEWNLSMASEITRFVTAKEVVRLGLRPRVAGDLRHDPAALAAAIYDELRSRELGYTSTVLGEQGNQVVQTPAEVLAHGTPNCVDLTALYAGVCLAAELVPLVTLVTKADHTRHALVWVVPNADGRQRKKTDLGKIGGVGHVTKDGRAEVDSLLEVADANDWIPVETTGASRSALWTESGGAPASISFDEAVEVGREVLSGATKIDLIDVHRLQHEDQVKPWTPPELAEALRRRRRRRTLIGSGAAAVALVVGAVFVWPRPFAEDRRDPMPGGFNVAVAGLAAGDSRSERDARNVPNEVARDLRAQYEEDPRYVVWGPAEVGTVEPVDAGTVADELQSDVLIYGEMIVDPADDDIYAVDVRVNSSQHAARSPWPIQLDESVALTVPIANVAAGLSRSTPSILSLTRTLDGMAALLADAHDVALERLVAAQEAVGDDGPALIPALRAWTLLAEASFRGDAALVTEARALADEALRRDASSEFARIVSVSVDYMSIIPVRTNAVSTDCERPADAPERPEIDDVIALRTDIEAMLPDLSPIGQVQLTSFLGRLAISEAILTADGSDLDLSTAIGHFDSIIDRAEDDPTLRIWEADAHRWLGLLADVDLATPADVIIDHYVASADAATPIWKSRAYGSAGRAALCSPDGSEVDAACFFALAARGARDVGLDADLQAYTTALDRLPMSCPDDWTVRDR